MNIDDELEKAIQQKEQGSARRPRRDAPTPKRNLALLIGLIVIAVVVLALLPFTFKGSAVWATTVDQLVSEPDLKGRRVRVEGILVKGSLMKRDSPCEYRFQLRTNEATVQVRYPQCVIPDSLQDRPEADITVTAEGTLGQDNVFVASQVLAKCPSKYEQKDGKTISSHQSTSR